MLCAWFREITHDAIVFLATRRKKRRYGTLIASVTKAWLKGRRAKASTQINSENTLFRSQNNNLGYNKFACGLLEPMFISSRLTLQQRGLRTGPIVCKRDFHRRAYATTDFRCPKQRLRFDACIITIDLYPVIQEYYPLQESSNEQRKSPDRAFKYLQLLNRNHVKCTVQEY